MTSPITPRSPAPRPMLDDDTVRVLRHARARRRRRRAQRVLTRA